LVLPKDEFVRLRLLTLLVTLGSSVALAPAAVADTSQSSNWAGYAAHGNGTSFTRVLGEWRQPRATCVPRTPTYSAIWVGIGGFSVSSTALEQIGTELDCRASGSIASSAWYELVPAPSQTIHFVVQPGDLISANVTVTGRTVVLSISNLTKHRTFSRTLHGNVDVSSAEWIVEAPSDCFSDGTCQTLPLANFGSTNFRLARAVSTAGHTGSISDSSWGTTKIDLTPDGRRFASLGGRNQVGTAIASALAASGDAFSVTYRGLTPGTVPSVSRRHLRLAGHLVHPTRR
jgi:hypothetical protein